MLHEAARLGYRRRRGTYRQLSYAQALKIVGCQCVEAMVRPDNADCTLRGGVARQSEDRLPKRMMFGSLVGKGKGCGRWGQHWMGCHEKDLEAFGIDMEGWTAAAK